MLPLEKIRIIDITEVWAGPMSTSILGDMGAQVIRLESYPRASTGRPPVAPVGGRGLANQDVNAPRPWDIASGSNMASRNKLGITLDLSRPKGKEVFRRLVEVSDVVVVGYSAGTMPKLGLDYPVLREWKPDIIAINSPGWGEEGPYQGYVTLGNGIDAYAGHHLLRGYPDLDATQTRPSVHSDAIVATTIAFAALVALHYRNRTGVGQWIDLSHAEVLLNHLPWALMEYNMNGRVAEPIGNRDRRWAPQGNYPCKGEDMWAVISVTNDEEFAALCRVIGHPELITDPRFADVVSRTHHHDEIDEIISQWTRDINHYDVMNILQKAGVPAGVVMRDYEPFDDPHVKAREFFETVTHPYAGTHRYPGVLWKYSKTPMSIRMHPTVLGGYNEYVYGDLLGLSTAEVAALKDEGYIGDSYAPDANIDARDRVQAAT